jgi:hypothetical protein
VIPTSSSRPKSPRMLPLQLTEFTCPKFTQSCDQKLMFMGLLELVSWFRQKHCECSESCYRLQLQCVDCEIDFEGGMIVGDPNELLLSKMSFTTKYHRPDSLN